MSAIEEISAERRRQIEKEGWSLEHDDRHTDGSMAAAAACYAMPWIEKEERFTDGGGDNGRGSVGRYRVPKYWPSQWSPYWWKPKGRRYDLVRAGALIVAEIERLDRAAEREAA
jgi:hypothetical protein